MGIGPFSRSTYDRGYQTSNNPDPKNYQIKKISRIGKFTVVEINYPNCKNYEGNKVMVYKDFDKVLIAGRGIDPHFSKDHPDISPIARFVPTIEGWNMAVDLVNMLNKE